MNPTVLGVSFPFARVSPDTPGGAEQVLLTLDSELSARGWGSVVVAPEGSRVEGTLVPTPYVWGRIDAQVRSYMHELYRKSIGFAVKHWKIDLVHMHGLDFFEYMPRDGVPALVTLHLPVSWYPEEALLTSRPLTFFNCVSRSQERTCPEGINLAGVITNGVPVERFSTGITRRNYALAMGRICPEKGFHHAIDAARMARVPIVIAGAVFRYEEHEEYFRKEISPRVDGRSCVFAGLAGFPRKRRLLAGARCVLIPSLVPETSSLVAMEALASGTPVVAFRQGALTEIVEHGRTGFLVDGVGEMADAIAYADTISRDECRAAAHGFSSVEMADKYIDLYSRIAASKRSGGSGVIEL